MKLLLSFLLILLISSCIGNSDYDPNPSPKSVIKSTQYYVYKSITKKNGVITFTNIHDGTCTAKSYYQINQYEDFNDVTFVSYSTCNNFQTLKGTYSSPKASIILNGIIYTAFINKNELTVSKIDTVMEDTYEEITIARSK